MTLPHTPVEDDLVFLEESGAPADSARTGPASPVWRILIIDDDSDVHAATTFALGNIDVLGRSLQFVHAYSAREARSVLRAENDIAVILLDVVMEQEDAGLQLVRFIRQECRMSEVRIILRTGQPGYAPEMEAIRAYDINDYKTKSELTRVKLFTAVTAGIRSYQQLCAINAGRRGLDLIVHSIAQLMALKTLGTFADGVIHQVGLLLGQPSECVLCLQEVPAERPQEFDVIAATGIHQGKIGHQLASLGDGPMLERVMQTVVARRNRYGDDFCVLYFGTSSCDVILYVRTAVAPTETGQQLLDVFSSSLAVGFENLRLMGRLHDLAFFDPLCKLPNRTRLVELLEQSLDAHAQPDATLALIDIDHFAETNDAFGHQFGDLLLLSVASRLRTAMNGKLMVARVGGDTFCLIGDSTQVTPELARTLFAEPFQIDGEAIPLTATTGLLRLAEYEGSGAEALKDAEIALKRAKSRQRSGHFYFSLNMGTEIRRRIHMLHALRTDFDQRRLTLAFQPQIELVSRRTVGVEALLRWCDEDGVQIAPEEFIPIAEHSGLIVELGAWVLRGACEELVRMRARGLVQLTMSINVSQAQFRHPQFIDMLRSVLQTSGAPPSFIELEITESMAMEDPAFLIRTLDQVRQTGVSIAIDDFGTGFSSLSYLQQLRVDRIKIDRSFVTEITDATRGSSIAEMIIQLGRNLNLMVIAEGVEDERQAAILIALGCPLAQGYLFAEPMNAADLADWLRQQDQA